MVTGDSSMMGNTTLIYYFGRTRLIGATYSYLSFHEKDVPNDISIPKQVNLSTRVLKNKTENYLYRINNI